MKFRIIEDFSFLNILVFLLIISLALAIFCPFYVLGLLFFKIPLCNMIYWENDGLYVRFIFIPTLISYILVVYAIPLSIIGLFIEKLLIKYGIILPKTKIQYTKKQKIVLYIILTLAIVTYLIVLGGWIHTLIPYTPEELEQLRYD